MLVRDMLSLAMQVYKSESTETDILAYLITVRHPFQPCIAAVCSLHYFLSPQVRKKESCAVRFSALNIYCTRQYIV